MQLQIHKSFLSGGDTGAVSNLHSDYEEGTWSPIVASGTVSVTSNSANYVKVGKWYCLCRLSLFQTTGSGSFAISNFLYYINNGNDEGHVVDALK